jgi:hypothetical protein
LYRRFEWLYKADDDQGIEWTITTLCIKQHFATFTGSSRVEDFQVSLSHSRREISLKQQWITL